MSTTELPAPPLRLRRPTLAFGPFTFDPDNQLLRRGADDVPAPPRVLGVLDLLLERAGDLVARQDLIDRVWKDAFVTDTSLAEAVSALRQILGDDPQSPTYIQTVHRRGYRFVAPVEARGRRAVVTDQSGVDAPARDEVVTPSIGGQLVPWSLAVLCGLLAAAAIFRLTHRQESPPVPARFALQLDAGQRFDSRGLAIALSPDGARAAWAACRADGCRIYVRPLDLLEAVALGGTEDAASPFYSPDGAWLGFFADGKLKKISLAGGAPTTIADVAQPLGAVWTADGRIIFGGSPVGGLWQVSENGGDAEPLTTPRQEEGEVRHAWPSLAPDGRTLFFSIATTLEEDAPSRLGVATMQGRSRLTSWVTLLSGVGIARPLAEDLIVLAKGAELQAVSFDPARRSLGGVPQTLVPAVSNIEGRAQFAASPSGSLLYLLPDGAIANSPRLGWLVDGAAAVPVPNLNVAGVPALSSDGRRIAWAGPGDGTRADIRIGDLDRGAVTRVTHDGVNSSPVWSPDGQRLYFALRDEGLFRIASTDADGGHLSVMPPGARHAFPGSVSADGRTLAFVVAREDTKRDVWVVATADASKPREVLHSTFDETAPALSADGSLLAYQSDEGGRWDVYVQRIADGRRAIVSTNGGDRPFWALDGASIVYRSGPSLVRATVRKDTLTVGSPSVVGDIRADVPLGLAPDGRVLVDRQSDLTGTSVVIALHWDREARRLLGPPTGTMPR
jgi:DNA-binding winged helix-turn-helix (wHTH) protein/Tol biopolymer transport system component